MMGKRATRNVFIAISAALLGPSPYESQAQGTPSAQPIWKQLATQAERQADKQAQPPSVRAIVRPTGRQTATPPGKATVKQAEKQTMKPVAPEPAEEQGSAID